MIEIDRWPRPEGPLASHIEVFRRKIEMRVLNSYLRFLLLVNFNMNRALRGQIHD